MSSFYSGGGGRQSYRSEPGGGGGRFGSKSHSNHSNQPQHQHAQHQQTERPVYNMCRHFLQRNCKRDAACTFTHVASYLCWVKAHNSKPVSALNVLPGPMPKLLSGSREDKAVKLWTIGETLTNEATIDTPGLVTSIEVDGEIISWALNESLSPDLQNVPVGIVHLFNPADNSTISVKRSEDLPYTDPFGNILSMSVKRIGDSVFVICGGESGIIRAWRFNAAQHQFELVSTLEGHFRAITSVLLTDSHLWSASTDRTIRVWDINSSKCIGILTSAHGGHSDAVTSLAAISAAHTGGEALVASGGIDGQVKLWRANGELLRSATHSSAVSALCAFKDAHGGISTVLIGTVDGDIHIRSTQSLTLLLTIVGNFFGIQQITRIVDIGSSVFASGSQDGQIVVWTISQPLAERK